MSAGLKRWKPYPAYKDSGVEWLGMMPEGWKISRSLFYFEFVTSGSRAWAQFYADSGSPFVRIGNIRRDSIQSDLSVLMYVEAPSGMEAERTAIKVGDIFISITADIGSVGIATPAVEGGYISQHIALCRPNKQSAHSRFLAYAISSTIGKNQLLSSSYGGTKVQLSLTDIKNIHLALPPLPEQQAIAAFLDQQCTQIDSLIEKKQRMLELLEEKRDAVITQAVTRGLDPTVPMKDSGVEWLGMVPEGWEVKRLRFLVTTNPSKAEVRLSSNDFASFVPMEAVGKYGGMQCQECCLDEIDSGYTFFADGDILIAKITPCFENVKGAIAENLTNGIGFGSTEFHVVRPLSAMHTAYCFWVTISSLFRNIGEAHMYGAGGQKRIPDMFIKNFPLPTPPLPEQQAIADYLDAQCAAMDSQRKNLEKSIELLREYRASLITHAVTGKIDVRDVAPLQ